MKKLAKGKSDARKAIALAPDYFIGWYTVKSLALVVAISFAAYYAGKSNAQKEPKS